MGSMLARYNRKLLDRRFDHIRVRFRAFSLCGFVLVRISLRTYARSGEGLLCRCRISLLFHRRLMVWWDFCLLLVYIAVDGNFSGIILSLPFRPRHGDSGSEISDDHLFMPKC